MISAGVISAGVA